LAFHWFDFFVKSFPDRTFVPAAEFGVTGQFLGGETNSWTVSQPCASAARSALW
jgi:hypothetical protein